jgi:hypothetical protein
MDNETGVCIVGYALNAKKLRKSSRDLSYAARNPKLAIAQMESAKNEGKRKADKLEWSGGGLSDILMDNDEDIPSSSNNGLSNQAVKFVQWDPEVPPTLQPAFHIIIHKLTEDIDNNSSESRKKIKALEDYLTTHPDTIIVDSLDAVRKVISRERTCKHLREIQTQKKSECPFTQPNYTIVQIGTSTNDVCALFKANGLRFPIICKPIEACGTPNSHSMVGTTRRLIAKSLKFSNITYELLCFFF